MLVNAAAESVSALDCLDSRGVDCVGRFGCEQREPAVRALAAVMDRVATEYVLEVAATDNQQQPRGAGRHVTLADLVAVLEALAAP